MRAAAFISFCAATVLLLPLDQRWVGLAVWGLAGFFTWRSGDSAMRHCMGVLLAAILMLSFTPIHTDLSPRHFLTMGIPFFVAIAGPTLYLRRAVPGTMAWTFWPRRLVRRDIIYTIISVPLSWGIIWLYFFHLTPDVAANWPLTQPYDESLVRRFVVGINCIGIWDELFFINTVFVIMRRVFPLWQANLGQAVVYASLLNTMAFTGVGPIVIFLFALTQGVMFERSGVLLWVLIVHIIVDVFLVLAILQYHYPDRSGFAF